MRQSAHAILYLCSGLGVSALVFLDGAGSACGQSSGAFGNRSIGSSFSPGASTFTGAAGRGGAGGAGGFGAGGFGAGQGGLGTIAGATQRADNAGQVTGNERFVRQARQPGQFVGSDARDSNNILSQMATAAVLNAGRPAANNNTNVNRTTNSATNSRYMVRVKTDISAIAPITSASRASAALSNRLTRSTRIGHQGPIEVRLDGSTAVLTGYVTTVHDRALAERVALLEPGVAAVRNELLVTMPPSPPAGLPAPPVPVPPQLPAVPAGTPASPEKPATPPGQTTPREVQF